ncbi:hypothetical protein M2R28_12700 [Aeromonas hydrophila]|uniref:hypothetical protein n=1 Tax=Aeromonas hydrophila TaxID=644 RepID=UPI001F4C0045|nr:hypothetical protein [Aeromonas hydrophila]MCO4200533.1 hypothetical protein [Aeromonas hydrophila]UNB56860.1 hypothetical protein MKW86_13900 [Aeromonas hydrophila]
MIHIIRLIISFSFIWFGIGQVSDTLSVALASDLDSFRVSGIVNIWASFCAPLFGLALIIHVVMSVCKIGKPDKFFNRGFIAFILVAATILTVVTKIQLNSKVDGYVECQDLKRISRWNSYQVFALSDETCKFLKEVKDK